MVAPMRLAIACSMRWSKALSSVAMTAQLGLVRHAAFFSLVPKADMLIGTCASRRKAASASLASAAKPALNFSGFKMPNPSGSVSITNSGGVVKPVYWSDVVSPASGDRADT